MLDCQLDNEFLFLSAAGHMLTVENRALSSWKSWSCRCTEGVGTKARTSSDNQHAWHISGGRLLWWERHQDMSVKSPCLTIPPPLQYSVLWPWTNHVELLDNSQLLLLLTLTLLQGCDLWEGLFCWHRQPATEVWRGRCLESSPRGGGSGHLMVCLDPKLKLTALMTWT